MPDTEQWTIGRLLTWTTEFLKQSGSPRLDAEVLLAEARGCERIDLYTAYDEVATEEVRAAFRELVRRRREGVPVAYLVGKREFYSLSFFVNPDVLIPRPETEFLVVAALDWAKRRADDATEPIQVADVGTGSGNIAVSIGKHLGGSRITAIDISEEALRVAARNVRRHGLEDRIELTRSDLFAELPPERRFDLIVSNPPYVSRAEFENLDPDVRDHEPKSALLAGESGTEVIRRLVAQAGDRLNADGALIMEISPMLAEQARKCLREDGRFRDERTTNDLAGHARVAWAIRA